MRIPAATLLSIWLLAATAAAADWRAKVDPWVLSTSLGDASTELLVLLEPQADLGPARRLADKRAKGRFVVERLRQVAASSQGLLLAELRSLGLAHRPFWIANMVWVRADRAAIQRLAERPDVARLAANPRVALARPEVDSTRAAQPSGIEWNLHQIGAPDFWAASFTGQGVVVAGQDTGYDWDHPALINQYRGWNGVAADHNYNWHDAIHSGGGSCGADSPEPCDDGNHGTHTLGTMVGDDGGLNQIGVAPGARWIGCRNMDEGFGTPATYSECFQFFLAPTDLDGQNPDPDRAPHVINNSWSCPPVEGCTDPEVLRTVVDNARAAGIVVVVAAGNSGSSCETVNTPPAIYEASLTVGATDSSDVITSFSSRGGVTIDGSSRLKPNVAAPGRDIRSSLTGGGYSGNTWQGTSMAAPHVAGQVALLISADPRLAGDAETLERCIEATAVPRTSTQECTGVPGGQIPNNVYGWGRVALELPLPPFCSPAWLFGDGFESGDASGWSDGS